MAETRSEVEDLALAEIPYVLTKYHGIYAIDELPEIGFILLGNPPGKWRAFSS